MGDHYGIVLEGEITLRYKDGSEEITRAGDYFHGPTGHAGWTEKGVVVAHDHTAESGRGDGAADGG